MTPSDARTRDGTMMRNAMALCQRMAVAAIEMRIITRLPALVAEYGDAYRALLRPEEVRILLEIDAELLEHARPGLHRAILAGVDETAWTFVWDSIGTVGAPCYSRRSRSTIRLRRTSSAWMPIAQEELMPPDTANNYARQLSLGLGPGATPSPPSLAPTAPPPGELKGVSGASTLRGAFARGGPVLPRSGTRGKKRSYSSE